VFDQTGEEREITQLQYVGWPDHGVPENASVFLQFINQVRLARQNMVIIYY
jgi:tyrosine-protein phosphatase non-receptor type 4